MAATLFNGCPYDGHANADRDGHVCIHTKVQEKRVVAFDIRISKEGHLVLAYSFQLITIIILLSNIYFIQYESKGI